MRTVGSIGHATLQQIRRCAADLIAEHGYEAMNLRQLATRVGIKGGSLYNHIGSKQELLFGLLVEVMEDLQLALKQKVLCHEGPLLQFQAFVQMHIQFHVDRKNDVMIASTELRSLTPENLKKIVKARNAYEAELSDILRRGTAARIFAIDDVKLTTLALIPLLTGVSHWYRSGGRLSRKDLLERYTALCLTLIGASVPNRRTVPPMLHIFKGLERERRPYFGMRPRRSPAAASS